MVGLKPKMMQSRHKTLMVVKDGIRTLSVHSNVVLRSMHSRVLSHFRSQVHLIMAQHSMAWDNSSPHSQTSRPNLTQGIPRMVQSNPSTVLGILRIVQDIPRRVKSIPRVVQGTPRVSCPMEPRSGLCQAGDRWTAEDHWKGSQLGCPFPLSSSTLSSNIFTTQCRPR